MSRRKVVEIMEREKPQDCGWRKAQREGVRVGKREVAGTEEARR